MSKVKFNANTDYEYRANFTILQSVFHLGGHRQEGRR